MIFTTEEGLHVTDIEKGGMLIFRPDGRVHVLYREEAILAASHGSNRAAAKAVSHGELTPAFKTAAHFALLTRQGFEFPADADEMQALKLMEILRADVWPLVLAMAHGDADELRAMAAAMDTVKAVAIPGTLQPANFQRIAKAIGRAAELRGGVPTIPEIVDAVALLAPEFAEATDVDSHVRKHLPKMGLGWLTGPGVFLTCWRAGRVSV